MIYKLCTVSIALLSHFIKVQGCVRKRKSVRLSTPTPVNHHVRQITKDNVQVAVKVQHGDVRHFPRCTARPSHGRVGVTHQLGMGVLGQKHGLTFARAKVGFVGLGRDNPVPTKGLKVDLERVATAARLYGFLRAGQARHPTRPASLCFSRVHL